MFTPNKTLYTKMSIAALALVMTAGTCAAMAPEPENNTRPRQNDPANDRDQSQTTRNRDPNARNQSQNPRQGQRDYNSPNASDMSILHFAESGTLIGSNLRDTTGNDVGSIDDFIVDRGSGRIAYAVITSGDFWGMGGKQFALPYNQLHYLAPNKAYSTEMTKEQVQRQTEFLPKDWNDLTKTSWMDKLTDWGDDGDDLHANRDEMMRERMAKGDKTDINGRVTRIDRITENGEDMTVVWVTDESGKNQEVVLGPSWYVMGMDNGIRRDNEIELNAVEYDGRWYATNASVDGRDLRLRDKEGKGYWSAADQQAKRYFLLSQLNGHQVEVAGSTAGEVQSTVVEVPSGYVAMIGLDPNENLFGMGDDISLIPFSAVHVGPKLDVSIEGSSEQIQRSLMMPENLDDLRTPSSVAQAYNAFGVNMPEFSPRDQDEAMRGADRGMDRYQRDKMNRDGMDHKDMDRNDKDRTGAGRDDMRGDDMNRAGDAWSRDSKWTKTFAKGDKVTIEGVYRGMKSTNLDKGAPDAQVLVIDTDAGRKNVILGPSWYVDKQKIDLNNGDKIKITGRQANYNNGDWIAATDIQHEQDSWRFWDNDSPSWTR